ncbi:ATP-NADH kinase Yef1p [Trichomonascus vanleenenianus]|uniref:ATP-NADH kinase Yef1p n=1 Tax=Trichomonascus vanleenenianus TaxID=2268995 RepID=UPI003EC9C8AB
MTSMSNSIQSSGITTPSDTIAYENCKIEEELTGTPHIHSQFDDVMMMRNVAEELGSLSLEDIDSEQTISSHARLVKTATGVRTLASKLGSARVHMDVQTVLIVTKARDNSLIGKTRMVAQWILDQRRDITVYVDSKLQQSQRFDAAGLLRQHPEYRPRLQYWTKGLIARSPQVFDLVVALGGDGTTLMVGQLFQQVVPPVISFSLGSLGFLTNYKFETFQHQLNNVFSDQIRVNLRMRFSCCVFNAKGELLHGSPRQVVNDIVIDRGPNPWLSMLELYGNDSLLTVVQADGLILSTPTGSTAYSLSAGGALVHPEIPAMCITPICPHTLSFRPMLLPDSMKLRVQMAQSSRSTSAWVSFDGRTRLELKQGDYLTVEASTFPFPTIECSRTEFIDAVSRSFHWNNTRKQKPFDTTGGGEYDIDFDEE